MRFSNLITLSSKVASGKADFITIKIRTTSNLKKCVT